MATNLHEARARARKVVALTDWIWLRLTPQEQANPSLPDAVAGWTDREWEIAAAEADVRAPSPTSRTEVVARLRRLVDGARRALRTA